MDPMVIATTVALAGFGLVRPDMSGYKKIPVVRTLKAMPAILKKGRRVVCKEGLKSRTV